MPGTQEVEVGELDLQSHCLLHKISGFSVLCAGLNEDDLHSLICLTAWSPVNGNVWERLGNVALLEEACHWGQSSKTSNPRTSLSVCLLEDQDVSP